MSERTVRSLADLVEVLAGVTFAPSCVDLAWTWEVTPVFEPDYLVGWLVWTTFERPDTETGVVGRGAGRKEFIPVDASESAVVKTCWLLAELIIRHELMEAFHYRGVKIFDPHHSVDELSMPHRAREKA